MMGHSGRSSPWQRSTSRPSVMAHALDLGELSFEPRQMFLGDPLHVAARPLPVFVKLEQDAAVLEGEAERAGLRDEGELVKVRVREAAISVVAALRSDEAYGFVVSNRLGRKAASFRNLSDSHVRSLRLAIRG